MTGAPRLRRRRGLVIVLAVVVAVAAVFYVGRLTLLAIGADEGDVPPLSSIPAVPAGATVLSETKECASGGCWWKVVVEPPPGVTATDLASEMGIGDMLHLSGNLWDPRTIELESRAESRAGDLTVTARFATG